MGKTRLLATLDSGTLPIYFGSPHPMVAVVLQDGTYRLRELVVDEGEAEEARVQSMATDKSWMPEQYYGLGRPTGRTYLEASTAAELRAKIIALEPWPHSW